MAINIKNYVDISTTFPSANVAGRSFGGLVFTASVMLPQTEASMVEARNIFEGGGVCYLTLDEIGVLFGTTSDEYKFATGYYGYISPSGRFASRLAIAKVGAEETALEAFTRVNNLTNLFGSFTFLSLAGGGSPTAAANESDIEMLQSVAAMNSDLDAKYLFVVNRVRGESTKDEVSEECKAFKSSKGTVFVSGATDVSGYMPMAILGSTDYTNGQVVNFMFKQFAGEEPTVTDDVTYAQFAKDNVNFYGRTQTNGQTIDFYQRGFNTDGMDTAIYCNEMWFKAACETSIFTLIRSIERISADDVGVSFVRASVLGQCSNAVRNGTFMAKEVADAERVKITNLIQNEGLNVSLVDEVVSGVERNGYYVVAYLTDVQDDQKTGGRAEKAIVYYVFYGDADSIRYIKGNNVLI